MIVMKFGGTSMGSAARMISSVEIMRSRSKNGRIGVIVSAVGGVSNRLQNAVDQAVASFRLRNQENEADASRLSAVAADPADNPDPEAVVDGIS